MFKLCGHIGRRTGVFSYNVVGSVMVSDEVCFIKDRTENYPSATVDKNLKYIYLNIHKETQTAEGVM